MSEITRNDILKLKGKFIPKDVTGGFGGPNLGAKDKMANPAEKIGTLINQLNSVKNEWASKNNGLSCVLVSVKYRRIVPKGRKISSFFTFDGPIEDTVVGARFNPDKTKHIVTHYISKKNIDDAIKHLSQAKLVCEKHEIPEITKAYIDNIALHIDFSKAEISKSKFLSVIVDAHFVEKFYILDEPNVEAKDTAVVTIYDIGGEALPFLQKKLGLSVDENSFLDETTLRLFPDDLEKLKNNAGYLLSMEVPDNYSLVDLALITRKDLTPTSSGQRNIHSPSTEPTIGVIDTMFAEEVYFSEWVTFENRLHSSTPIVEADYNHGTSVTSIIVDGPALNRKLDDGCGNFQAKHFGVATANSASTFFIMREIKKIVAENPGIKVWNLSLGSNKEINDHFVSPEGSFLDKLQCEHDVVFIVSGTNKPADPTINKVGSPADSINSIVVNSVDMKGQAASYTRTGPVLTFFQKPDVSYYGGDLKGNKPMIVYRPTGDYETEGTSFAAPWVARKMAFLIHIMNFTREEAKALIIDAAAGWDTERNNEIGFGVVPIKIEDIVTAKSNEIKFIVSETSQKNTIYNYGLPVPIHMDRFPYKARATICYFSPCSRIRGVDYTDTELTVKFGRMSDRLDDIDAIDKNRQYVQGSSTDEKSAREMFGKWENVKQVRDKGTIKHKPKLISSTSKMWGLSIKSLGREIGTNRRPNIRFGIVVTLSELNGMNRIKTFIDQCSLRGWIVHPISITEQIDIHNISTNEITLED